MTRYRTTSIAAMAAIFALSACAHKRDAVDLPSAGDTVDLGVVVNGKPLDQVRTNPEETNKILADLLGPGFGGDEGRGKLRALLKALDEGSRLGDVTAFQGICGFSTAEFVRALVNIDEKRITRGLVGDYLVKFDGNTSNDGFRYRQTWPGHLTVDMRTETFRTIGGRSILLEDRTEILQWHIEVVKDPKRKLDGFEVRLRQGDAKNDPNDPFPGTVEFPPESLDPTNDFSVWKRGLDHKLWAQGREIVVHDIFRKVGNLPTKRLPDSHEFYRPCKESCIDMMTRGFPPAYRIEFPEQSGYCLGRCQHPNIMNSM